MGVDKMGGYILHFVGMLYMQDLYTEFIVIITIS